MALPAKKPLIIDAHEDLAWNIHTFGRDYTLPIQEIRRREAGSEIPEKNGDSLLSWEEYQRGRVAVVFATLFAAPRARALGAWDTQSYADYQRAHDIYWSQLDTYRRICDEHPDQFRLVLSKKDLEEVLADWSQAEKDWPSSQPMQEPGKKAGDQEPQERKGHPVGLVILMEGADGVRSPEELEDWWQRGVRLIGPAWEATRYSGGTNHPGPLTREGFALLEAMSAIGYALDVSHMDEEAVLQALDAYPGTLIASHSNIKALLRGTDSNRFLTDRMLQGLLDRNGVIGVVPFNKFLKVGWEVRYGRQSVTLQQVVAQIDAICQRAGNAQQCGLGTDFDGGFGWQSVPEEINTIADLQKLGPLLAEKGYSESDIASILGQNWLNMLKTVLPEVL